MHKFKSLSQVPQYSFAYNNPQLNKQSIILLKYQQITIWSPMKFFTNKYQSFVPSQISTDYKWPLHYQLTLVTIYTEEIVLKSTT